MSRLARTGHTVFASYFFNNSQWATRTYQHVTVPALRVTPPRKPELGEFRREKSLTPVGFLKVYGELSKPRLSVLNVLTAMSGVALSPLPVTIPILLSTAIGTALCAASANAFNMIQEVPLDAQMARTRMRPLVRRAITPLHATGFGLITGIAGPAVLWTMVNPLTAVLGASNIFLYAVVYTWSKRKTVANTWIGAVVGALPPVMGWTAAGGAILPSETYPIHLFLPPFLSTEPVNLAFIDNPLAPFALFMLLFSWQFPHFNSISHLVRGSYTQAGYKMLSVLDPAKNALVSLRHSILMVPICSVLIPLSGLTTWTFAITSLLPNAACVHAAWSFWKRGGEKEARALWKHCLWYLPVVLGLMMFHKPGTEWLQWLGLQRTDNVEVQEIVKINDTPTKAVVS